MTAKETKPSRRWYAAAFVFTTLWLSIGCNPATLSMFFVPFVDDKIPATHKLAVKGKEVTVCVLANFAKLETRSDLVPAESELPELVAQQLRKRCQENKEKVKIIPPARTRSYSQAADSRSLKEIGKHFQADYVIVLEIQDLTLYEKASSNLLYRGNIDLQVRVVDLNQQEGDGTVFSEYYRGEFPGSRPVDASEMNIAQFRQRFLNKVAADVARFFTAYPREQRLEID